MTEFITALAPYKFLFLTYAIIWGFSFGIGNTLKRIQWLFSDNHWSQNELGILLDVVFWFSCVVCFLLF